MSDSRRQGLKPVEGLIAEDNGRVGSAEHDGYEKECDAFIARQTMDECHGAQTITYRGFIGSVSFSGEDSLFYGKVEGIDGLVNFEGDSIAEFTRSFHEAVDDYIALREEAGVPSHVTSRCGHDNQAQD